jgi:protein-tyrosine phosphatase
LLAEGGAIIDRVIDLHAHILPGLDDGPATEDGAVALARVAVAGGTRAMATTSHVNHSFGLGPAQLSAARSALGARLKREGIDLELLQGGEIAPDRLPALSEDDLRALTLGSGRHVLLECPFSPADGLDLMVADLQRRGFGVLLAHPERSPSFLRNPDLLAPLVERGALAQVTAGSLIGAFGETVRRAANTMLERGLVHVLASDSHDARHRAPELDVGLDPPQAEWMTATAPSAIVAGRPLPERPPLPRARGLRARLRAWSPR